MRILLLGYKGLLGSDLMLRLMTVHDLMGRDVDDFDITLEKDCARIVGECAPDVVINAAAYTNVDGCETDKERCFAVNAGGVRNIALACREKRIVLVHFSTDYIFDGRKGSPYGEEDRPLPLNVYGASKLAGEGFLRSLSDGYLLIRTAWLYGAHGRNFVKTILEKASGISNLDVVDDQIGSPTYSRDLAAAVQLLIEGGHRGVFHVTNSGRCSWYEFAVRILQYAGKGGVAVRPIRSDRLSRAAVRPAWSVLDCGKFSVATGMEMRSWETALGDCLEQLNETTV